MNTTKYANGVHTIYWIATDDAGAADGIGSRYFNIVNTGAAPIMSHREERSDVAIRPQMVIRASGVSIPPWMILNLPMSFTLSASRRGFNLAAPAENVAPDNYGVYHIRYTKVEPVQIYLDRLKRPAIL